MSLDLDLDPADVKQMNDSELLEAVRAMESRYKKGEYSDDHRRHLSRTELEHVFRLAHRRAVLKTHFEKQRS